MPTNFDDKAATWDDDPAKVERARVVAEAIRATVPLAPSTRLLEYGAGTGLVSQALADHIGPITLAEPSAGMRRVMVDKVAAGTLPHDARIWALDLTTGEVPDERFDLIATVMTLHHIPDLAPVLHGFATLLAGGGSLCVVDLEEEDGSFHSSDSGFDGHHGFSAAALEELLHVAGFTDVRFEQVHEINKEGGTYPLFLATAMIGPGSGMSGTARRDGGSLIAHGGWCGRQQPASLGKESHPMADAKLTRTVMATRDIDAPAGVIFELIADPSQQPRWDGNENLREAAAGQRVREVGDVFTMVLSKGSIRENHVVEFEEGRRIAWQPADPGEPPAGHLWRWELEPTGEATTKVTHTYDWSQLTDRDRFARARATTSANLQASLDLLARLAEEPPGPPPRRAQDGMG